LRKSGKFAHPKSGKMNCVIVDDDEITRMDLEHKVKQVSFLNLLANCSTAMEATDVILNDQVDLVILDVMMPGMNGLQLMKALENERPQVILVSSDQKFALEAFEHDVTDFLVKPVLNERFFKAVVKAKKTYEAGSGIGDHDDENIFLKVNSKLIRIDTRDILVVEALADYVTIHTANGKYTVHSTMKGMEVALPEKNFFRAHNSYIIRLDKITSIEDSCMIIGDKLIPISRSKMKGLLQRLKFLG
jgi:DNA-binding LytR/AlgR family response regulator